MALFTALFRNLNTNKSLEEKLSMAKKFYSSNLPIPNRTEPAISWILNYLGNNKSGLTNEESLMLWKALEDALKYEKNEKEHVIALKSVYAEIITEEIKRCNISTLDVGEAVLSCTKYILWSPSMNSIFTAEYDTLMILFSAVLNIVVLALSNDYHQTQLIKNASQVLNGILECLESLACLKSNLKKVFSSIIQQLELLTMFFYLSNSCKDADLQSMSDKLLSYLVTVIFGDPKCYEILLMLHSNKKGTEDGYNSIIEFLYTLRTLFSQKAEVVGKIKMCDAVASFIAKLMQGYLIHKRNDSLRSIHVLTIFCAVVGVDIPFVSSASISCKLGFEAYNCCDDMKICALKKILQTCSVCPQDFSNYIEDSKTVRPLDWLRKLFVRILGMNCENNQADWFACLNFLLNISSVIFDYNLLHLMKKIWTEVHIKSPEAKQQHSLLFCSLLNVYQHLQQLPRFIEQFFVALNEAAQTNTGGELVCEGYVPKPVEISLAHCAAVLPCGQALELWKLFNSVEAKLASLWSSPQHNVSSHLSGAMLLTSRLYYIFLFHSKLFDEFTPPVILAKVGDSIKETHEVIVQFSSLFQAQDTKKVCHKKAYNLSCSILMLSHAVGEMTLAFSLFTNKHVELLDFEELDSVTDVSILHPYLERNYIENVFSNIKMDTDLMTLSAIRLIIQKAKALVMKGCSTELEKKYLKSTTTYLFKHIIASHSYVESTIQNCNAADNDKLDIVRNTIDLWHLMLKHMPLFIPFVSQKELMLMCCTMIEILVQENQFSVATVQEETLSSVILHFISHEFFLESKKLQSSFVTAVWKYATGIIRTKKRSHSGDTDSFDVSKILQVLCNSHSEWAKHASSTPKQTEKEGNLNAMWLMVENVSALMHEWLDIHSESQNKFKIQDAICLLKVVNYLPLEYLLPGNQMRCTLGLSVLMLLLPNCLHKSNSEEIQELAVSIFKAQIAIFEGVRSIWLFDFVKAEPFLKSVIQTIAVVFHEGNENMICWSQRLLEKLFSLSMRNASSLEALKSYFCELTENISESKVTFLASCVMFQRLVSLLQRHYLEQKLKEHCMTLAVHVGSSIIKCLKRKLKPDCSLCSLLVKCYSNLFEVSSGETHRVKHEKEYMWLKKIPPIIDAALDAVQSSELHQRSHLEEKFKEICISLALNIGGTAMKLLKGKEKSCISIQGVLVKCCVNLLELSSGGTYTIKQEEEEEEDVQLEKIPSVFSIALDAIQSSGLLQSENLQQNHISSIPPLKGKPLSDLLELPSDKTLGLKQNIEQKWLKQLPGVIDIALDIIQPSNGKEKVDTNSQRMLSRMAQKYLSRITYILTLSEESTHLSLRVPYFKCMTLLLKKLGNTLPRQTIVQCLHPCIALHVDKYAENPHLFTCAFAAVWNILNELIVHHPYTVLASRPAFLTCVANLLRAAIKAGNENFFLLHNSAEQREIALCAQNIDRLLTAVSKYETEFQKMVPYLITVYVEQLQNITVHPSVKVHITSGINRLFDICSEDSIKMLSVSIGFEGREIYSSLVKNYKQIKYSGNS